MTVQRCCRSLYLRRNKLERPFSDARAWRRGGSPIALPRPGRRCFARPVARAVDLPASGGAIAALAVREAAEGPPRRAARCRRARCRRRGAPRLSPRRPVARRARRPRAAAEVGAPPLRARARRVHSSCWVSGPRPVMMPPSRQDLSRETARPRTSSGSPRCVRRRRRNPPGNAQAPVRQNLASSGERPGAEAPGPPKGCGAARAVLDLSGHRTEGRQAVACRPYFFGAAVRR